MSKLGKLKTSARSKKLNQVRVLLIILGILMAVVHAIFLANARSRYEDEAKKIFGPMAPRAMVKAIVDDAVSKETPIRIGYIACGCLFIVFGIIVHKYPLPITILGLVMYIGAIFVGYMLSQDPKTLYQGAILKLLIIGGLISGIQTAVAIEKEKREASEDDYYDDYEEDEGSEEGGPNLDFNRGSRDIRREEN